MTAISADQVKELRDRTGAGMMDCKAALKESGNDLEKAVDYLRKKGMASAAKRAGRDAKEGVILAQVQGSQAALVEANCETDFVARTDDFQNLAKLALQKTFSLGSKAAEDEEINKKLAELSGKIGEKMLIKRTVRMDAPSGAAIFSYIHANGKLGVLVQIEGNASAIAALGKDIAMQIAAANPQWLDRTQVPSEALEREKAIYREEVKGKPENIVEKILQGKLEKFYQAQCLIEQPFIKDDKLSVKALIEQTAKTAGPIKVLSFTRYQLGEVIA